MSAVGLAVIAIATLGFMAGPDRLDALLNDAFFGRLVRPFRRRSSAILVPGLVSRGDLMACFHGCPNALGCDGRFFLCALACSAGTLSDRDQLLPLYRCLIR